MSREQYTAIFERGDRPNQWIASIKELPECHTFGRGLAQTRARIREALALWVGDEAESADIVEVLPLPPVAKKVRKKLKHLHEQLQKAMQEREDVLVSLRQQDWSVRDLAEVFALSHQRIGQITPAKRKPNRRRVTSSQ